MSCWCWQRMTTHTRRWAHLCRWRLAAAPATATKRARSGCCSSAGGLPPLYPICHYTLSAYVPHLLASWLLSALKSSSLISPHWGCLRWDHTLPRQSHQRQYAFAAGILRSIRWGRDREQSLTYPYCTMLAAVVDEIGWPQVRCITLVYIKTFGMPTLM